ncbi:MAG: hypothetical protein V4488_20315 [Pseudomonadota bacterium]
MKRSIMILCGQLATIAGAPVIGQYLHIGPDSLALRVLPDYAARLEMPQFNEQGSGAYSHQPCHTCAYQTCRPCALERCRVAGPQTCHALPILLGSRTERPVTGTKVDVAESRGFRLQYPLSCHRGNLMPYPKSYFYLAQSSVEPGAKQIRCKAVFTKVNAVREVHE